MMPARVLSRQVPRPCVRDIELSLQMRHASQVRKSRRRGGTLNTNFIQLASEERWTELCALDHAEACVDDFDTVRRLSRRRPSRIAYRE